MASTIVGVMRDGDGSLNYDSQGYILEFTESYIVTTDDATQNADAIILEAKSTDTAVIALLSNRNSGGTEAYLPDPYRTVHRGGNAICQSLTAERDSDVATKWTFSATFTNRLDLETSSSAGGTANNGDPTQYLPTRTTNFEEVTRRLHIDRFNRAYMNGAGTMYPFLEYTEELSRWEWGQFNTNYDGVISSANWSTTFAGLPAVGFGRLTEVDVTGTGGIYPPGVYQDKTFFGWNEDTVAYLNGGINFQDFLGYDALTLLLKVRSSKVIYFGATQLRFTEFSMTHDPKNWMEKTLNAGPYFLSLELDADGNPKLADPLVKYPYIYYTKDVETESDALVRDQLGLLGDRNITATYNAITNTLEFPNYVETDGEPIAGVKLVTTADGDKTYRAVRPDSTHTPNYIEFAKRDVVDFNLLRVR